MAAYQAHEQPKEEQFWKARQDTAAVLSDLEERIARVKETAAG